MIARRDDLLRIPYKASRLCSATVCFQLWSIFRERVELVLSLVHAWRFVYIEFLFRLFPNFCLPFSKLWSKNFSIVQVVIDLYFFGECLSELFRLWLKFVPESVFLSCCRTSLFRLWLKFVVESVFWAFATFVQVVVTKFFFSWECFLAGCDWIFLLESVS
jgi:hypothetical protein